MDGTLRYQTKASKKAYKDKRITFTKWRNKKGNVVGGDKIEKRAIKFLERHTGFDLVLK